MAPPKSFGIVGYGHFGRFLAQSLKAHGPVLVADLDQSRLPKRTNGVRAAAIEDVAKAAVVFVAVPFDALEIAIKELRDHLPRETVVIDVVSTKARATDALVDLLEGHPNVIASHPLFGPPSMKRIRPGLRLVVTHEKGPKARQFRRFLERDLGLSVLDLSADEHDRAMAYMQALPFFIARALVELDVLELPHRDALALPSFEKLENIASIELQHSDEMFDTSQRSNPFAEEARSRFLQVLEELHEKIRSDQLVTHPAPAPRH